ncbi:TPA: restriction endonuclease subunit S [Legionella pneumophila]|nr:restriction endonuclease subunit S [Legionella pneumophila]
MKSDWRQVTLDEVSVKLGDGLHGTPNYENDGEYYFINGNNLNDGKISYSEKTRRASKVEYEKYKKDLNKNTVFVSINGTLGNTSFYNNEKVILGKSVCYINLKDDVNKYFIRYVLKNNHFQDYLDVYSTGTTIKNMPLKAMREYKFYLPELKIQNKVAHVLSTLDDKIELNNKINQTLESIAQAMFKSWFVDFDPVHAKANAKSVDEYDAIAKELGISREILDLFPSEFEESELGLIPKGWGYEYISKVSNVGIGKTPPRKEKQWFIDKMGIKWVSIKDMGINSTFIMSTSEQLSREAIDKFNIKLVPAFSVLLSFKLTVGRVSVTTEDMCTNEAIAHFNLLQHDGINTEYLYLYLKTFDYGSLGSTSSIASAINSKIVKTIPVLIPQNNIINRFDALIAPLFKNILFVSRQIDYLEKIRDLLLPKLLSGEIDVSNLNLEPEND